jgi:hypothetical protein
MFDTVDADVSKQNERQADTCNLIQYSPEVQLPGYTNTVKQW